ncbi:MAG: 50S ribosomal protein L20, partial [Ktedonobacteraceae bacterium]
MPRVKRGVPAHKKHKRLLQQAEGNRGTRRSLYRPANEAVMHAMAYMYRDRRVRKRDMRALWITRINAAARMHG